MKYYNELISEINGNKNLTNDFGGFNYRNAEDMLTNIKPLLIKYGFDLSVTNDILEIADKPILKTIATLTNTDGETKTSTTFVGVDEERKGMNTAQNFGASLSYNLKYCLCYLFLISPEKNDCDSNEYTKATGQYNYHNNNNTQQGKNSGEVNEYNNNIDKGDAVVKYLETNPTAFEYYKQKYNVTPSTPKYFKKDIKFQIYDELITAHKMNQYGEPSDQQQQRLTSLSNDLNTLVG